MKETENIRIIEPFPFFLSKQTTEPGKSDSYGLQEGSLGLEMMIVGPGKTDFVSTHLLHRVYILDGECKTVNLLL